MLQENSTKDVLLTTIQPKTTAKYFQVNKCRYQKKANAKIFKLQVLKFMKVKRENNIDIYNPLSDFNSLHISRCMA